MIAQVLLTTLLFGIVLYAWQERRRSPIVATLSLFAASTGVFLVWVPSQASDIAELVGVGRGVDLIIYIWIVISLLILLNLHLKLRVQLELTTALARRVAIRSVILPANDNTGSGVAPTKPRQAADRTK
jgi:small membrane protein